MKNTVVNIPSLKVPIQECPGFQKKELADYKLDIVGLCGFGCRYCSSNSGTYLRRNTTKFADLTQDQHGERLMPASSPELTFHYDDIIDKLNAQLDAKGPNWGKDKTLVFSMLTDGFSPKMVANGTTEAALRLLVEKSSFRIRVLTKNSVVGNAKWVPFFQEHSDRFVVGLSIGTLDDAWAETIEIGTSKPSARLKALRNLQDAGVPTFGMLCPVFPDMTIGSTDLEGLVDAIRPTITETVWAEPYNERDNWQIVRAGYSEDSQGYEWFTEVYGKRNMALWSDYAVDLYERLRAKAEDEGWLDRLKYLLYELNIQKVDVPRLLDHEGILFQSLAENGLSKNPAIADVQRERAADTVEEPSQDMIPADQLSPAADHDFFEATEATSELFMSEMAAELEADDGGKLSSQGELVEASVANDDGLPEVLLPYEGIPIRQAAEELGRLLAEGGEFYRRGGAVVMASQSEVSGEYALQNVDKDMLRTEFERVATLKRRYRKGEEIQVRKTSCPSDMANAILKSRDFVEQFPEIRAVTRQPILTLRRKYELVTQVGYDPNSGILAGGSEPPEMTLEEAKDALLGLLGDYKFASESDRSRALAFMLTPALTIGRLLPTRAPFMLFEADASQSGKGYLVKIIAAIYGEIPTSVVQRNRGAGSMQESFDHAVLQGRPFIYFDNTRGKIDSPALESFLTEPTYSPRVAYRRNETVDTTAYAVFCTSNNAEFTQDLRNRAVTCRILKQSEGYPWMQYKEGNIFAHIEAHQSYYLGAVHTVIIEWWKQGWPETGESRHDRREWVRPLDWIVQNLLDQPPLLDNHNGSSEQASQDPWMIALADIMVSERPGEWLQTAEVVETVSTHDLILPGTGGSELTDENRSQVYAQVGRRFGKFFGKEDEVTIGTIKVSRREADIHDEAGKLRHPPEYRFAPSVAVTAETFIDIEKV